MDSALSCCCSVIVSPAKAKRSFSTCLASIASINEIPFGVSATSVSAGKKDKPRSLFDIDLVE